MPGQATQTRSLPATQRAAVRHAWNEYLAQTRTLSGLRYREVEPWAWTRLQSALKKV